MPLVKIKTWCEQNDVDLLSTLKVLEQQKIQISRIGNDHFVDNIEFLENALIVFLAERKKSTERKREEAKLSARHQKIRDAFFAEKLARGEVPENMREAAKKEKKKKDE